MTEASFLHADPVEDELKRNLRHNFIFNALDGAHFWLGYSFMSPTIILPLYVSRFTDNPLVIGLVPFFNTAFFLIPQLFMSNVIERAPRKKFFPATLGFFLERLPIFLMPFSALLAIKNPILSLVSFLFLFAWHCLGAGLTIVGWQDMIAKVIPVERRGLFFGVTNFSATATAIVGGLGVALMLGNNPFPMGYVLSFSIAAVLIFLSWVYICQTREPASKVVKPKRSQMEYLRSLPAIIRGDANFSRYLIAQIVIAIAGMATGFLIVYGTGRWSLPDSQAGGFIIAMQVGQASANLLFGYLSDRKGHKLSLEISTACVVLSYLLALAAPDPTWLYPIFFLRGVSVAAALLSGVSIAMEFSAPEDRPTYMGLANTLPGIASSFAPLLAGLLAGTAGYPVLFILAALVGVLGFVLLRWWVREPRFNKQQTLPGDAPGLDSAQGGHA